jgi:glycosyltransferase involved in cell wall biosynthesis
MKLSILIPVYNERRTLREILKRVMAQKIEGVDAYEIVLVDDCSKDGSVEIIKELQAEHPEVIKPVLLEQNQGKGNAIRTAIKSATGDIGIIQDADLEYDPGDYEIVLRPILKGDADVRLPFRRSKPTSCALLPAQPRQPFPDLYQQHLHGFEPDRYGDLL